MDKTATPANVGSMEWLGRLPQLPPPFMELHQHFTPVIYEAWALQMQVYARAAVTAWREACVEACNAVHVRQIEGAHEEYMAGKEMAVRQCVDAIRNLR